MKILALAFILLLILNSCDQPQKNATLPENTSESATTDPKKNRPVENQAANPGNIKPGTTEDNVIIPGKSIGLLKLNEQAEVVYKLLGKPDKSDAAMGKALATWFSD